MTKTQEILFDDFLNILKEAGALDHIILIGSWAEYMYENTELLSGFQSIGKTTDVDFLIRNLRKPEQPVNIVKLATEKGYVYQEDYITGYSKFMKDDFEIEFLICQKGNGTADLPRTNIGINAQELTHLEVLKDMNVRVDYKNLKIYVPEPEAYVLQKMSINSKREKKEESDREKISNIFPFLDMNRFNEIFPYMTKKEQKAVIEYAEKYCPFLTYNPNEKSFTNEISQNYQTEHDDY